VSAPLTLALPKGRLLEPAQALLGGLGVDGLDADSRRLLVTDEARALRFIFLKPVDIPTYVEYGAADLGIVGKDILAEQEPDVYEPVDLGFGACRLVVAEPRALWERDDPAKWSWVRVATKYPSLTERYFSERGIQVEMIRLDGSIELAPQVGLAERIVDLVQSGETLRANGLVEVAQIMTDGAAHVNRASLKTAHARVSAFIAPCARSRPRRGKPRHDARGCGIRGRERVVSRARPASIAAGLGGSRHRAPGRRDHRGGAREGRRRASTHWRFDRVSLSPELAVRPRERRPSARWARPRCGRCATRRTASNASIVSARRAPGA
jgi:ATP phosphoribosyltransferase